MHFATNIFAAQKTILQWERKIESNYTIHFKFKKTDECHFKYMQQIIFDCRLRSFDCYCDLFANQSLRSCNKIVQCCV